MIESRTSAHRTLADQIAEADPSELKPAAPTHGLRLVAGRDDRRARLIGRERELGMCRDLLDRAVYEGGAVLLTGPPGVGKTSLLNAAADHADALGHRVLRTAAAETEQSFAFAALQPLLMPVLEHAKGLPEHLHSSLLSAMGVTASDIPTPETVAMAVLSLLSDLASSSRPVCLIVDDVQWLDTSSSVVLRFIARRLAADPVVIMAAGREVGTALGRAIPEIPIHPLELDDAEALLASQSHDLSVPLQRRILAEAQGNPLALVELARAVATHGLSPATALLSGLPLTGRLEAAFAQRIDELPQDTRAVLLLAALAPTAKLAELLAAANAVAGVPLDLAVLDPAELAGLINVQAQQVVFSHPLLRSAVIHAAPVSRRRAAHAAVAQALPDLERRLYHLAEATIGYDNDLAAELDQYATAAVRRGSLASAVSFLRHAAALTAPGPARGSRIVRGAGLSFELGDADVARLLLTQVRDVDLSRADHARARMLELAVDSVDAGDLGPVLELVGLAQQAIAAGDHDQALDLLHFASRQVPWSVKRDGFAAAVVSTARAAATSDNDPRFTAVLSQATPIMGHRELTARLDAISDENVEEFRAHQLIGFAAANAGDYERSVALLSQAEQHLRSEARLAILATVLTYRAVAAFCGGRWRMADQDLDEAGRLADDTVQERWLNMVRFVRAGIVGMQRDDSQASEAVEDFALHFEATNTSHWDNLVTFIRGITASFHGRHDEAVTLLGALFDPTEPMFDSRTCSDALFYFADAAVAKNRLDDIHQAIAMLEEAVPLPFPPALQSAVDYARAVIETDPHTKKRLFDRALDGPARARPFDRARLLLAYGTWLRRDNQRAQAREHLRDARIRFERLGNEPFAEQAVLELRAAGEASPSRSDVEWDRLTAQETQIARLVAEGLSNKQIGEQLFLSPRTISSHLYRMFPKLGITSRGQLTAARLK